MCGEFGEVLGIIDLVINLLAGGTLFLNSYDTLSYPHAEYHTAKFALQTYKELANVKRAPYDVMPLSNYNYI